MADRSTILPAPKLPTGAPLVSTIGQRIAEVSSVRTIVAPLGRFEITVGGPALVRLDLTYNSVGGGVIYSPTAGGFVTLWAYPRNSNPSGSNEFIRAGGAHRGTGPLIHLPHAGTWIVQLNISLQDGALLPSIGNARYSIFEGLSESYISNYLQYPPSSVHVMGNIALAAGATTYVFSATGIDLSTISGGMFVDAVTWLSCSYLRVGLNTTPVTGFYAGLGRRAVPATPVGRVIVGAGERIWTWPEIAGQAVHLANGSAGAVDVAIEAHFI